MRILMIVLQICGGLTFIPWFIAAGLSFMIFDSPRAYRKIFPWILEYVLDL